MTAERRPWATCGLLLVALAGGVPAAADDPRSTVLVAEDCTSSVGRREVTLFANGTVRRREGPPGQVRTVLGELGPEEVEAYLARLGERDLSETDAESGLLEGSWIEACTLELNLPGRPVRIFRYDRYSSPSLALGSIRQIVREIEGEIDPSSREQQLPAGYVPELGDLLERTDGVRFEIVAFTADERGIELSSPDQPLTLYIPREEVALHFQRLLRKGW